MERSEIMGDQFFLVEYQLRIDGNAIGSPGTVAIHGDPQDWRRKQTGGAVLLSATPISKEEFLMKSVPATVTLKADKFDLANLRTAIFGSKHAD
jgi:hypothetical protein